MGTQYGEAAEAAGPCTRPDPCPQETGAPGLRLEGDLRACVNALGGWALRTRSAALAVFPGGGCALANAAWQRLDAVAGGWRAARPADAPAEPPGAGVPLIALVAGCSEALLSSDSAREQRRFQEAETGRAVEVVLERLPAPEGGEAVVAWARDAAAEAGPGLSLAHEDRVRRERMRAVGEMASGLAHDLNNTLNVLTLRVRQLALDPACVEAQGACIRVLSRVVDEAATMVGRLQDFARQRCDRPLETTDPRAAALQAAEQVRAEIEASAGPPVRVRAELPPLPDVPGCAAEVRQVIVELLRNAREAMPDGGEVRLAGRARGAHVELRVADDGPGIAPEHLHRVFEPFFTTKGPRGTGLGLSGAWGVMNRLGGSVAAENGRRGAVLTLRFPRAAAPSPAAAPVRPRGGPARVLVVDDDRDNLEVMREALEAEGLVVDVAESGPAALRALEEGLRPDLVLCDVGMPGMDGWHAAAAMRERLPRTPIHLVTGWAREIPEDDPRRRLVDGVIPKPVELERVLGLLGA